MTRSRQTGGRSPSAEVRAKIGHPVIDGDGHLIEVEPILIDYIKRVGGQGMVDSYVDMVKDGKAWGWYDMSWEQRRRTATKRPPFYLIPARNTHDRATGMIPRLMYERLDEFGVDVSIVYPSQGLLFLGLDNTEMRRGICRAMNMMHADLYGPYKDRLIVPAMVPVYTPEEAVEELEFAVKTLGFKGMVMEGNVRRPITEEDRKAAALTRGGLAYWIDPLAFESQYDYDPLWRKCVELGVAPTCHSGTMGWPNRTSISSYVYNHLGHFAAAGEAFCKAMFMGGVTKRFPSLRVAFLEGGVGWACSLYNDLFEHWEKRNATALRENLAPETIDRKLLVDLVAKYGDAPHQGALDQLRTTDGYYWTSRPEKPEDLEEFALSGITRKQDIVDRFIPNFFFGCEADDRMVPWAFADKVNRRGAKLNAIFSSDISHWDVEEARETLAESYEFVEHGQMSDEDYKDFVFRNSVRLHTGMNPNFFKGTPIEAEAAKVVAEDRARAPKVAAE